MYGLESRRQLPTTELSLKGNQFREAHTKYGKCLITLQLLGSDKMTEEQILNKNPPWGQPNSTFHTHRPTGVQKHCSFGKPKGSSGCLWPTEQLARQFYHLKKVTDLTEEQARQRRIEARRVPTAPSTGASRCCDFSPDSVITHRSVAGITSSSTADQQFKCTQAAYTQQNTQIFINSIKRQRPLRRKMIHSELHHGRTIARAWPKSRHTDC